MNWKEAIEIAGTDLGEPRKMPGFAFGLPARACITGASLHTVPNTVCKSCYAFRGNYLYRKIQAGYQRRLERLDHPQWVEAMVVLLQHKVDKYGRKARRREVLQMERFGRLAVSETSGEHSGSGKEDASSEVLVADEGV